MACVGQAARRTSPSTGLWFVHTQTETAARCSWISLKPVATRANGLRPRKISGFSTSPSSVLPRTVQTHRHWCEPRGISAARSRNSPPASRYLLFRAFSLAAVMTSSVSEVDDAVKHLLTASRQIDSVDWALRELGKLAGWQCAAGREPFQHAVKAAVSRWQPSEFKV